jgi:hypothetical protein
MHSLASTSWILEKGFPDTYMPVVHLAQLES